MGALIGWLVLKLGVSAGMARAIATGGLVLLVIAALGTAKCAYDRNLISKHEAKQEAATAKADRKADAKAAEERRSDDARLTHESHETQEAIDEAKRTGRDPRAAYYECIRLQQAARKLGEPSPDC